MKLSILQPEFKKGLDKVSKTIGTRSPLPITSNVLLMTDQGRLKLVTTNLDAAITTWIGAKIEIEGAITVPYLLLHDLVSLLPKEEAIDVELVKNNLKINCGKHKTNLPTRDAKDFPPIPTVEGEPIEIESSILESVIKKTIFAAATDESRPILTAINVKLDGNTIAFAGADGYRLAVVTSTIVNNKNIPNIDINIPAKSLGIIGNLLDDNPVKVFLDTSKVLFRMENLEFVSQCIQGTYPNYQRLIPESHNTRIKINRDNLIKAVKQVAIFARDGSGVIRFETHPDNLRISAQSEESDGESELAVKVEGQEIKFAVNGRYILNILECLEAEIVSIDVNNSSSPLVITGDDNVTHVLALMFVQW